MAGDATDLSPSERAARAAGLTDDEADSLLDVLDDIRLYHQDDRAEVIRVVGDLLAARVRTPKTRRRSHAEWRTLTLGVLRELGGAATVQQVAGRIGCSACTASNVLHGLWYTGELTRERAVRGGLSARQPFVYRLRPATVEVA